MTNKIVKLGRLTANSVRVAGSVPVPPASRSEAARYVSYRNLLATGRAVKHQRSHVLYSTAGDRPQIHRLTCTSGKEAKRIAQVMSNELRKATTDHQYNSILARLLDDIRDAWPEENRRVVHVHSCELAAAGQSVRLAPDGRCECGFEWAKHQLSKECRCHPDVDADSDLSAGGVEFVKHRPITRTEVLVTVTI